MKIPVQGSEEYIVDTEAVTCTCKQFRYRSNKFPITSEKRQCKHIAQVFTEHPELMPPIVAKAMKDLDNRMDSITENNSSVIPRSLADSYYRFVKSTLAGVEIEVYAVGDFLDSSKELTEMTVLCKSGKNVSMIVEGVMELLGHSTESTPGGVRINLDNLFFINIREYPERELMFRRLCGYLSKPDYQRLADRISTEKHLALLPSNLTDEEGNDYGEFPTFDALLEFLKVNKFDLNII